MNILILEDDVQRQQAFQHALKGHSVVYCASVSSAKKAFSENSFDILLLDHDLGGTEDGATFANWLPDFDGEIVIHSMNVVGAANMRDALTFRTHAKVKIMPYPYLIKRLTDEPI